MQLIKKILIAFAGGIIVLHSMIPHNHNKALSEDSISITEESNTLLDYISLALHLDLGENHLENFVAAEDNFEELIDDVHFPFINQEFTISSKIILALNFISINISTEKFATENIKFPHQFRGPPAIKS